MTPSWLRLVCTFAPGRPPRARRMPLPAAGFLALLAVLALFTLAPRGAQAATYRTWIAQQASQPVPGQVVRVWINSDTALGETAGVEYNVGSTYVRVLGTFDTSYSGANWRVDIPATVQTLGTTVRYQLFTRNQSGTDYGFTGFNWSYTVTDVHWTELLHDTFNSFYRSPFGAQPEGTSVTLRFRTAHYNVTAVGLHVYQLNPDHETSTVLDFNVPYDSTDNTYDYWKATLTLPASPTIWYYKWKLQRGNDGINSGAGSITDWYSDDYADDHDNLHQGGTGTPAHSEPGNSYQLSVYDPNFQTPAWMQNAVIYQIFPDRFRNGDPGNDPTPNSRIFYGNITATLHTTWNEPPEDGRVTGFYNRDFYGGDLQGVINKLDYLQAQGITALYFTPIVKANSNHRYDTDNYETVDPYLGDPALFQALSTAATARGMHIILDGVYNHTSSDSVYFDRYHRYATDGACESLSSAFRPWYSWNDSTIPCTDASYNGWFGYSSLAVLDKTQAAVRDYIFGASNNTLIPPALNQPQNVTQFWYGLGVAGFRFDVADDATFHHNYWQAFRPKAKGTTSTWGKSDGPLIGEIWPDASSWLLGNELDSVMNYRFRKDIIGFARYPNEWHDNDNNGTNNVVPLLPSQFDTALKSIREDYPPAAQYAMMNLVDSHDTNRVLPELQFGTNENLSLAKARLGVVAAFQFTYIGAPTIYYGDEAGLYAPGVVDSQGVLQDDPYNRAPFPWDDTPGYYGSQDHTLSNYYAQLAAIRNQNSALRTGDFRTLLTDDAHFVYSFGRSDGSEKMVVVLNNNTTAVSIAVPVSGYLADGTQMYDKLGGAAFTVSGGTITVSGLAAKGVLILADNATPTAAQVGGQAAAPAAAGGVDVQWVSASEVDHLGYNVLRADRAAGPYRAVNAGLVRNAAIAAGGGPYRFHDAGGTAGSWYQIEAVDTHNQTRRYPAFAVGKSLPPQAAPATPQDQAARGAALARANAAALQRAPHPPLAAAPYKLLVSRAGVTRVTYEALQAAGVPLGGVNPGTLALTTGPAGARAAVPLALHLATPGVFAPGDWFDFIAQDAIAPYGNARAYYLAAGSTPGLRMAVVKAAGAPGSPPVTFGSALHLEENHIYWQYAPDLGAPQPEGPWYWTYALDAADGTATLAVPDADPRGAATLTVLVQGYTSDSSVPNDHHLALELNGTRLSDLRWRGTGPQQLNAALPAGLLASGSNTLRLHIVADTGAAHDGVLLASADLTYPRYYRAAGDHLQFTAPGGAPLVVGGFGAKDVVLYDVTAPGAPQQVAARVEFAFPGYQVVATAPGQGPRQFLAAVGAGLVAPDSIAPVAAGALGQGGADYLVIAADSLLAAGQDLAALHAGEGLRGAVVPVSAIYDQYGTGVPAAGAVAAFLAAAQAGWKPAPRYVALLGSASWDPNNYLGLGTLDLLPTRYVATSIMGRTASDVSLVPTGPTGQPLLAVGRLPVGSPAEAAAVVAKLAAYRATSHTWNAQVALVSDAAGGGAFDAASEHLAGMLGGLSLDRIYESHYGAGTGAQIVAALNSGRALVNYYGHAAYSYWSDDNIFDTTAAGQLTNAGREPFVTSLTCFTGDYDVAFDTSLLNALVLKPQGGAIGGLGGTAASLPAGQHALNEAFYTAVRGGARLGEALRAGYAATPDPEVRVQFGLIGDPALRLDLGP